MGLTQTDAAHGQLMRRTASCGLIHSKRCTRALLAQVPPPVQDLSGCPCPTHSWPHLQAGTSHNLGDNFARAFGTRYLDESGQLQVGWPCSCWPRLR